jgi:hypothetical protein
MSLRLALKTLTSLLDINLIDLRVHLLRFNIFNIVN